LKRGLVWDYATYRPVE